MSNTTVVPPTAPRHLLPWLTLVLLAAFAFAGFTHTASLAAPTTDQADVASVVCPECGEADNYFLVLEGLGGDTRAPGQSEQLEIMSFSWGQTRTGAHSGGGGGGGGKVNVQDFHFTMKVSKASPKLMLACATGQHIKRAILTARKAGGEQQEYLTITLTDVYISSYSLSGDSVPVDQFSLNFAKIEYKYVPLHPDGSQGEPVQTEYDVKTGRGRG